MSALKENRACRDVDQSGPNDEHGTVIRLPVSRRRSRRHDPPVRQRNVDRRKREYLTPAEVQTLMGAARGRGRQGHRDATMILVAYQHGLRAGELVGLTWCPERKIMERLQKKREVTDRSGAISAHTNRQPAASESAPPGLVERAEAHRATL